MNRRACVGSIAVLAWLLVPARAVAQEMVPVPAEEGDAVPPRQRVPMPPPAPAAGRHRESGESGQSGGVLEVHLGSRLVILDTHPKPFLSVGSLTGGFMAGYRTGCLMLGVGLEIGSAARSSGGSSESGTSLLIVPGIRVGLARTADSRVELFGQLDLGLGHWFASGTSSNFHFTYQVGPGVRYWVHPHLAIGVVALLRGDFTFTWRTSSSAARGVTSIDGALDVTAVF